MATLFPGSRISSDQAASLTGRRVAIIGAGPGGLAAAMKLGHAGAQVTVYERHAQAGGRSGRIRAQGYTFDIGPTFFLYPEILQDIFRDCGLDFERNITLRKLATCYQLVYENGPTLDISSNLTRMKQEIATKISPADAANIDAWLRDNREKFDVFAPILKRPFNSWRDLLRPDMLHTLPMMRPFRTVDQDLARYFHDPRTRLAFSFQSKYLGMSPYQCPSLFTILSYMEHEFGIFHAVGGTATVMDRMQEAAENFGVVFRFSTPVQHIHLEQGKAAGVVTDYGIEPADAVVMNADFAHGMRQLVANDARPSWSDIKIANSRYSCSTFMMYLGVDRAFSDHAHHTIFLSDDYDHNFARVDAGRALPSRPSLYVQNACVTDPSLAPQGCSTLYVLMPVANLHENGLQWRAETQEQARGMAYRRLEEAGFTGIPEHVRFEKIMTPQHWKTEHDVHRGAVFNLSHDLGQMLNRRPHNRFNDIPNLYIVGGGTHPGSGLPVIFEGARISTDLLMEDLAHA
ncbi:phytoene desaturase family protein [Gluconobacter morbifer]|uniref:Amine oxidase domain-containing protein n=1 Tax=Gluconobacter morbifer G707 TaxID=1088869 RepID=G6XH18_9PROT|nr:phytoene desaturase family protein [Gluconobacter morbifer]EHH69476.1 hypothetical protein GMO_07830 [Gluconobacter morbifer G707]